MRESRTRRPNETTNETPNETTDETARSEEAKDRVGGVPTTPRRVQSTRLSAWANKSRGEVLTPVKSDDTDDDDTDDDDDDGDHEDYGDHGDEGSAAAPAPVGRSPSQNLADARRELRLRRSEEVERGARRILVAGAADRGPGDETDGNSADENENRGVVLGVRVDEAEAAERRERIMRETKAELREIRRRETERRLEREAAASAEAERTRARELRREQLRRSHGLKEARPAGAATPAAPVGTANLTVVVEEETTTSTTTTTQLATTRSEEETAAATRRKRADLESLAEYLKWELAREVRAYDAKREEVAGLTRERDEAVHRLGLAEARRRMGNLAA